MKKYKGLEIPENDFYLITDIADIQSEHCQNALSTHSCINCKCGGECLFDDSNLELFKEWYMLNKREDKLKRILNES